MICIISVTEKGDILGEKIKSQIGGDLYFKSKRSDFNLSDITKECFEKYDSIVFISSTGIAVRAISKHLKGKDKDPAVVVVDVCNKFSISLVSGHLGGANDLALNISKILNNTPVITTATDNIKQNSRHLAKRQMTWFRTQMDTHFYEVNLDNINETIDTIYKDLKEFLS